MTAWKKALALTVLSSAPISGNFLAWSDENEQMNYEENTQHIGLDILFTIQCREFFFENRYKMYDDA